MAGCAHRTAASVVRSEPNMVEVSRIT